MAQEQALPSLEAPIVLIPNIGSLDPSNDSLHTEQEPLGHEPLTDPRSPTQARQFSPSTRSRKTSSNINPDNVSSNLAGDFALPAEPLSLDTNRQALWNGDTSDPAGRQFPKQQMDTSGTWGCSTVAPANHNDDSSERRQEQRTEVSDWVESSVNQCGLPIQSGTKRSSEEHLEPSDSSSNAQLSPGGCDDPLLEDHGKPRAQKKLKKAASNALPRSVCHEVQPSAISLPITPSEQISQESANGGESQDSDNIQSRRSSFRYSSTNPGPGTGAEYHETPFSGVIKRTTIGHDTYYSLEFKSNALSTCFPQVMSLLASTSPAVALNTMASSKTSSSRERYTPEDDQKIIRLKDKMGLTWEEIADQFPGRSSTALHVRYSTKLRGKPPAPPRKKTQRNHPWQEERSSSLSNTFGY
ncbi:MYB DNA-binding domain containing protein [Apiospora kogelbergensis]|uniref:MYB DNA-binding domain containing protein n=1 Tax=Apiospora kogelbergensis TaxID=1337665 RepID=A0AAW0R2D9_9PEZI